MGIMNNEWILGAYLAAIGIILSRFNIAAIQYQERKYFSRFLVRSFGSFMREEYFWEGGEGI